MIKPYYSADGITVYHARFEDVLAAGLVPVPEVALIHADPPYGISLKTNGSAVRRSANANAICPSRNFPAIVNDDRPFDPAPLLALDRPTVLWGANHYAPRVPESPSWILWDKRDGDRQNNNADGELAWSNFGGPLRIFRHLWMGLVRASEHGPTMHPTQKPIALSAYVFNRAKLKRGALVFVPFLGSGPDLPAARAMGLRVVACDVERWCCDTAISRLGAVTATRAAEPVGPLFGGAS